MPLAALVWNAPPGALAWNAPPGALAWNAPPGAPGRNAPLGAACAFQSDARVRAGLQCAIGNSQSRACRRWTERGAAGVERLHSALFSALFKRAAARAPEEAQKSATFGEKRESAENAPKTRRKCGAKYTRGRAAAAYTEEIVWDRRGRLGKAGVCGSAVGQAIVENEDSQLRVVIFAYCTLRCVARLKIALFPLHPPA
eukprot:IDg18429t1